MASPADAEEPGFGARKVGRIESVRVRAEREVLPAVEDERGRHRIDEVAIYAHAFLLCVAARVVEDVAEGEVDLARRAQNPQVIAIREDRAAPAELDGPEAELDLDSPEQLAAFQD